LSSLFGVEFVFVLCLFIVLCLCVVLFCCVLLLVVFVVVVATELKTTKQTNVRITQTKQNNTCLALLNYIP
jgi:hypothetical protein